MNNRFSRVATAFVLAFSLWTSAIAVVAAPVQQQGQPTSQQQDSKNKKAPETVAPARPNTTRPLSTDEDPAMIGKRKINSGLIAKMSGSLEKEVAFGRQLAAEVDRQIKLVDDPVITEYVNRVGQNIVLHSDAKVPFTIKVVDTDEVNAFALPGGFFYVNRGLILAADNEAELAGVMAHEIAHVAARHVMENMAKAELANYGMLAGMILGIPPILLDAANMGLGLGFLKFSRSAESEADRLGVQYLYASGYDPNALATMFEKLAAKNKKKPGFFAKMFATHPFPPDRRMASLNFVSRFPEHEEYVINTSEFQRVKGRLLRMSNARATAGDIAGSTNGDNGTPGRPTLKRRQPAPDDAAGTSESNGGQKPSESKPAEAPKLKRNTTDAPAGQQQPSTQPKSTP
ncbi:MAG TPA: M48 family metallopeptidase [Pyrinomonadaceae bacterium]|jgi:predicted Zn-dependent protease